MNKTLKNLFLNGSDFVISILFTLIMSFIISNSYGDHAYGLYSVLFTILSALMLFDFGMSNVLVRLIIGNEQEDFEKSRYLSSAFQLFIIIFSVFLLLALLFLIFILF